MDSSLPRALHDAMSTRLGDGWLTGEGRRLYGGDDSRRWAMPSAVALPRTREDVVALVRACREHRVPLVARGAGTGTTGAAVPTQGGVVVSFARMDRILELRAADRCVVVEPGVLNGGLQQTLAPYGLFWPDCFFLLLQFPKEHFFLQLPVQTHHSLSSCHRMFQQNPQLVLFYPKAL